MTTDSPGQPPAIEGERVARAGARWTREEEEQLVVEVRAGTDVAEIAGRHGRRRLHDEHGELLLTAWAAECAEPGLTGLPPSWELGLSLARTAGVVRAPVAALAGAVRSDSDRAVLQRRLGMQGLLEASAVAALGLPRADRALAAQVIATATGARRHERDAGRGAGEAG